MLISPKLSTGIQFAAVAAGLHLLLVAWGAFDLPLNTKSPIGKAIATYSDMTGASAGYGFFAPGVDSQVRALFEVKHANGRRSVIELEKGRNSEFYLRTGDIIEKFYSNDFDDPLDFQRDLSTSLSGTVFARYPDANSVTIHLDKFEAVSMADYRAGARPDWKRIYSATFTRRVPQRMVRK